ncbi:hypothetical protein B0H65DRAFT_244475 [Neurospora tetraspora]|uniref:Uncharacterized protein n=1 Tax=Neurospora tetraspora TaxID=94610 RepID=A0AAE0JEZ3_9PEZI|nr:hypothetical protein B0H65DRAFT_244475 [Neurospora tetraspora]
MSSQSPIPLSLTISQPNATAAPPTLLLTLANTSPDVPITLLTWSSPLDPLALQLGLIHISSPSNSSNKIDFPKLMIKRAMPPPEDALVTLGPGEARSQEVVMREPIVDGDKLLELAEEGKVGVRVVCGKEDDEESGVVVWVGKKREDVSPEEVELLGRGKEAKRWRVEREVFGMRVNGS